MRLEAKVALWVLLALGLISCPKKPPEETASSGSAVTNIQARLQSPKCPEDMAWIRPANVCIDLFEFPNISGELPLRGVTYDQAVELCESYGKRLPTAREWEMACGGPEENAYPYNGDYRENTCWMDRSYSEGPVPSGSMRDCKSPFGVYDMTGNVWEWTSSEGFEKGTRYVRGGSWRSFPSVAICTIKAWEPPGGGGEDYGFRCALKPRPGITGGN